MNPHSRSRSLTSTFALLATIGMAMPEARAADHLEAPIVAGDLGADIADVYFFLDPNDNQFAVCAVTLHSFITPAENANAGFFDDTLRIRFAFENTGDAKPDYFIDVTHSKQTSRTVPQTARILVGAGPNFTFDRFFTAPTTVSRAAFGAPGAPTFGGGTQAQQTPTVTTDPVSGVSYFGGLIDDPFFFDLGAELAYRSSRIANQINPAILTRGRDSFAGTNTLVVDLRVPVSLIKGPAGDVVGLSAFVQRQATTRIYDPVDPSKDTSTGEYVNIDRMATPAVNTVFVSYGKKDLYNRSNPERDAANSDGIATDIVANLQALQITPAFINTLAAVAVNKGDYLRLNTATPNTGSEGGKNAAAAFPNGRRPNDDVIDTIVTLVNNGVFQGDAVDDNEVPMRDTFPFFAPPHMPFPPEAGADDLTRN